MSEKISVLMTVYNAENYAEESINSILNQTYKNFEFIIVDDFSDDRSLEIIKNIKDERIKLYKLEKRYGRTKALNFGLRKCESELIAVQDADDISHQDRLEDSLKQFESNNNLGLVCSRHQLIDENNLLIDRKESLIDEKKFFSKVKYVNLIAHSSVTFRRNSLDNKKFFYDESFLYAQDYNLILRFIRDSKISLIQKQLVKIRHYKKNMGSLKTYRKIRIIENIKLLKFSEEFLKETFIEAIFIKFYKFKNYLKLFLSYMGV